MTPITIKVDFWGPARNWVTTGSIEMTFVRANGLTIGFLRDRLVEKFPRLADAGRSFRFAINDEFVRDNDKLNDGDVVSVIPPVSGG